MDLKDINIELPPDATMELADPVLVQHYQDEENRIVWIIGEIDDTCQTWAATIIKYNREDRNLPVTERKPIKFYVDSNGGALESAEMLVEVMRLSKTPIWTIALSTCASAASLIYLAGHKRFALPNACFIFHKGGINNLGGTYDVVSNFMKDYEREIKKLEQYYIDKTKYNEEEVKENLQHDWYIRDAELIEKGIVDQWIEDIDVFF